MSAGAYVGFGRHLPCAVRQCQGSSSGGAGAAGAEAGPVGALGDARVRAGRCISFGTSAMRRDCRPIAPARAGRPAGCPHYHGGDLPGALANHRAAIEAYFTERGLQPRADGETAILATLSGRTLRAVFDAQDRLANLGGTSGP